MDVQMDIYIWIAATSQKFNGLKTKYAISVVITLLPHCGYFKSFLENTS